MDSNRSKSTTLVSFKCNKFNIYILYNFFEKGSILKVLESNIFKSILGFLLISCISATYAINYIESIVRITDIYVLFSSVLIVLYFSFSNKINLNTLLYTIFFSFVLDLTGSIFQILQINDNFGFEYSNAIKSVYGNKNIAAMVYMMKIPLCLILLHRSKNFVFKLLIASIITLAFYILLLLSSRTAFLALIISILLISGLILTKKLFLKIR